MKATIRRLAAGELPWANARYAEVSFLPSPPSDFVALAEVDGQPAGLGRVTQLSDGIGELGGMYVFPAHRGSGVSRTLIEFLIERSALATLYCLPFEHLVPLYRTFGFEPHPLTGAVPAKVREKLQWCQGHYADPVVLLCRQAAPKSA